MLRAAKSFRKKAGGGGGGNASSKPDGGGGRRTGRSRSPFRRRGRSKSRSRAAAGGADGSAAAVSAATTAATSTTPANSSGSAASSSSSPVPTTIGIASPTYYATSSTCSSGTNLNLQEDHVQWADDQWAACAAAADNRRPSSSSKVAVVSPLTDDGRHNRNPEDHDDDGACDGDDDTFLRMQTARYASMRSDPNLVRSLSPMARRMRDMHREGGGGGGGGSNFDFDCYYVEDDNDHTSSRASLTLSSDSTSGGENGRGSGSGNGGGGARTLGVNRPRYGSSSTRPAFQRREEEQQQKQQKQKQQFQLSRAPFDTKDEPGEHERRRIESPKKKRYPCGTTAAAEAASANDGVCGTSSSGGRKTGEARSERPANKHNEAGSSSSSRSATSDATTGESGALTRLEKGAGASGSGGGGGSPAASANNDKSCAAITATASTPRGTPQGGSKVPKMVRAIEEGGVGDIDSISGSSVSGSPTKEGAKDGKGGSPDRLLHLPTAAAREVQGVVGASTTAAPNGLLMKGRSLGGGGIAATTTPPKQRPATANKKDDGIANGGTGAGTAAVGTSPSAAAAVTDVIAVQERQQQIRQQQQKVFFLLLEPDKKIFELIRIEYDPTKSTVGDLLNLIPFHAAEPVLGRQSHVGLVRPRDGGRAGTTTMSTLTDLTLRASGSGPKSARIKRGEVLVPLPQNCSSAECRRLANTILKTPALVKLLSRDDPLAGLATDDGNGNSKNASKKRRKKKVGSPTNMNGGKGCRSASAGRMRHHHTSQLVPVVEDEEAAAAAAVKAKAADGPAKKRRDSSGGEGGSDGSATASSTSAEEVEKIRKAALDAASVAASAVLERRMGEIERRILVAGGRGDASGGDRANGVCCNKDDVLRLEIESKAKARRDLEEQVRRDVEEKTRARAEIEERMRREAEERLRERNMTNAERIERMAWLAERSGEGAIGHGCSSKDFATTNTAATLVALSSSSRSVSTLFSDSEGDATPCASPPTSPPKMTSSVISSNDEVATSTEVAIVTETVASLVRDAASVAKPRLRRLRGTVRRGRAELRRNGSLVCAVATAASVAFAAVLLFWRCSGMSGVGLAQVWVIPSTISNGEEQPMGVLGLFIGAFSLVFLVRFQAVARKRSRAALPLPIRRKGRMVKGVAIRSFAPSADGNIRRRA